MFGRWRLGFTWDQPSEPSHPSKKCWVGQQKTILILNILQLAHPCSSFFSCIFATLWFCSSQNNYCTSSLHDFPKTSHDGKIPIVGCQPLFWWSHISCLRCSSFNMWSTPLVDHHPWIITRWTVYTPVFFALYLHDSNIHWSTMWNANFPSVNSPKKSLCQHHFSWLNLIWHHFLFVTLW
jgi:hypothetical protein